MKPATPGRSRVLAGVAAGLAVAAAVGLGVHLASGAQVTGGDDGPPAPVPSSAPVSPTVTLSPGPNPSPVAPSTGSLQSEIEALRQTRIPFGAAAAPVPAELRSQPDLYARAFTVGLFTQDYRTPRADLLAWVQAESAQSTEPLVVGLVPDQLRDRLAVYSVTASTSTSGATPVPTPQQWQQLANQQAYTTVQDVRVSQPLAWSNAVDAGRITDTGVTARQVTARVVLHTVIDGTPVQSATSVALTSNFEGPPSRPSWGFVTAVTYTALAEGTVQ